MQTSWQWFFFFFLHKHIPLKILPLIILSVWFIHSCAHSTTPSDPLLSRSSCIYPSNVTLHLTAIPSFTLLIVFEYPLSTSLLPFPLESTTIPPSSFTFVNLSVASHFSGQQSNRGIKQTALPHPFSYPHFTLSPSFCYVTPSVIHWQQPLIPKILPTPYPSFCFLLFFWLTQNAMTKLSTSSPSSNIQPCESMTLMTTQANTHTGL